MSLKVAIVYDSLIRPDTTGVHCEAALRTLGHQVIHHAPLRRQGAHAYEHAGYQNLDPKCDLYLQIDDDISYPGPVEFGPSAYWCIDTHRMDKMVGGWTRTQKAAGFRTLFVAQQDGGEKFHERDPKTVHWLPLAADPQQFYKLEVEKDIDWCFAGTLSPERQATCERLLEQFPNGFYGQCYGEELNVLYNRSKVALNLAISNDINMRTFEVPAAGTFLLTNASDNGERALFDDALNTYLDGDDLMAQLQYFLEHEEERELRATELHERVRKDHTYTARVQTILEHAL